MEAALVEERGLALFADEKIRKRSGKLAPREYLGRISSDRTPGLLRPPRLCRTQYASLRRAEEDMGHDPRWETDGILPRISGRALSIRRVSLYKGMPECRFGVVQAAQARGDFDVLAERGRRILRVHLGAHVSAGLTTLGDVVRQALA